MTSVEPQKGYVIFFIAPPRRLETKEAATTPLLKISNNLEFEIA
jgi:hypothetical protein